MFNESMLQKKSLIDQAPTRTVTNESFGERMKNAFGEMLLGFVLVIFSIPVLWFNERRSAQMESVIAQGEADCVCIGAEDSADEANSGQICHVNANAHAAATVEDDVFKGATFNDGCLVLTRQVDMYCWEESKTERDEEQFGGGRRRVTNYSYTKGWSTNASRFENPQASDSNFQWQNPPPAVELGNKTHLCSQVEYGSSFMLDDVLLNQAQHFVPCTKFPENLPGGGKDFKKTDEYYYYTGDQYAAEIGDMRVRFTHIPDGPFTVLALQDEVAKEGRTRFLPYRAIERGIFGIAKDEEKKALLAEAKKSKEQLSQEDPCSNCPGICCCFKSVAQCFAQCFTPEIYHLYDGNIDKSVAFGRVRSANSCAVWLGRLGGWLMMWIGFCMIFQPIVTFLNVIPFLGPYFAKGLGFVIAFLSFMFTIVTATAISALAWLFYRPITTLMFITIAFGLCAAFSAIGAAGAKTA
jgi:hypothetical protein